MIKVILGYMEGLQIHSDRSSFSNQAWYLQMRGLVQVSFMHDPSA
jgi:hypothetical protein